MMVSLSTAGWLAPSAYLADPALGYVGLTLAVPVMVAVVIALACAALFAAAAALGLASDERWLMTLGSLPAVVLITAAVSAVVARLPARRTRAILSLAAAHERGLGPLEIGAKAANLALLQAAGLRVPRSWVVPGRVFEQVLAASPGAATSSGADARDNATWTVPAALIRELHRRLVDSGARHFLLRSSFSGEDGAERAAPGIYESAAWELGQGRDALSSALTRVWASFGAQRAAEYRKASEHSGDGHRCLGVLICERVPHERAGFASSVDPTTGFLERRLVDQAAGPAPWHGTYDLFTRATRDLAPPSGRPPGAVLAAVSDAAGEAAELMGGATEIEWGAVGDETWIYQARLLAPQPPRVTTLLATGAVELPPYPLTTLSADVLFGSDAGDPEARAVTLPGLRMFKAAPYLDAGAVLEAQARARRNALGTSAAAIRAIWTLAVGGAGTTEPPEAPAAVPHEPAGALATLRASAAQVRRAAAEQQLVFELAARASSGAAAVGGSGGSHGPLAALARSTPDSASLADRLWFWAAREAELSEPRQPSLGALSVAAATGEEAPSAGLPWLARRALVRREQLKLSISLANHQAHLAALALDRHLQEAGLGQPGDAFHLTLDELEAAVVPGSSLPAGIASRRATWVAACQEPPGPVLHLDADGAVVPDPLLAETRAGVAGGFPLGGGTFLGRLLFADAVGHDDARLPEAIVVLPDATPRWAPWAARAGAVALERGGPLSHLSLMCRERGVAALAAVTGASELREVAADAWFELDGDRGTLRSR